MIYGFSDAKVVYNLLNCYNLLYDQFWLPEGAKFFIYSNDRQYSIGAFTSANNKGERGDIQGFATELIHSNHIILEYYLPNHVREIGIISIADVVHGYRSVLLSEGIERGYGSSGDCQVNVNCPEGANWYMEKNAVAMIVVNGNRICTGSLVNTTSYDHQPYFLTANHCLCEYGYDAVTNPNMTSWTFFWHYESNGCSNRRSTHPSTSGAKVVANNPITDFALLKLTEDPQDKNRVTPFYLGWDRSGNPGTGGVGIHHPSGDIKKIATYNITPANNSNCMNFTYCGVNLPNNNFWRINWMKTTNGHSVTEGGSSGSPLINNDKHVIGQLFGAGKYCSNPNCANPSADIGNYGKFNVSWTGDDNPDCRRRLDCWLDPGSREPVAIDGCAAKCSGHITKTSKTYTGHNSPEEACVFNLNNVTFEDDAIAKFYAKDVIRLNGGTKAEKGAKIQFIATGCSGNTRELSIFPSNNYSDTTTQQKSFNTLQEEENFQNKAITIFPNPNSGSFTIGTTGGVDIQQVEIINLLGQVVYHVEKPQGYTINLPNGAKGTFFVRITTHTSSVVKKIIVQ
jgi:plasmid maintenance system killer protein